MSVRTAKLKDKMIYTILYCSRGLGPHIIDNYKLAAIDLR